MAWDTKLDPKSVAYAIAAAPEARIRVIAGPGTGKSFAMKRRVARLLESGIPPKEVLAVTFTRVAADDLHRELQQLGVPGCEELKGQTLHSLAMRILSRRHVLQALGRTPRPLNTFEMKAMVCDLAAANGGKRLCKKLVKRYVAAWAQSQGDEPGFAKDEAEKRFQADLLNWCDFHASMLIGELIPYLVRYLRGNPAAAEHREFRHLLVDEFQDLNKAEQTAIAYLGATADVCIVGDDDQSVYSFKYAHPEGIREWKGLHPGCVDLQMADCHRCPSTVVEMANSLISTNTNRAQRVLLPVSGKGTGEVVIAQLGDLDDEATWIAERIDKLLGEGVHPSEVIVLVQRSVAGRPILNALKAASIPCKSYYEESQLESEAAQQRFALFKLTLDTEDRVALRYLVGAEADDFRAKSYARLRKHCEETGESPWQALEKLTTGALTLKHTNPLAKAFLALRDRVCAVRALAGCLPEFIDALFPADHAQLRELRELALEQAPSSATPKELLAAMLKEITQPDVPLVVGEVRLMSLHKSKGLSAPYVFIAGCIEGILPPAIDRTLPKVQRDAAIEESRRLFYVGVTRVKADPDKGRPGSLFLSYAQQMRAKEAHGALIAFQSQVGAMANLSRSRFLDELGASAPNAIAG